MAVSLSNTYSLYSPRLTASFSKPSKSPEFKPPSIHFHHPHPHLLYKPILHLSLPKFSPVSKWRPIKSSLAAVDSSAVTSDEEEALQEDTDASENDADQENSSSLNSLLEVYKEAILRGDENTLSEIEATLYQVEIEKNKLQEKVSTLSAELSSGKEKYIRLQADFDNFRKRSEKERLTVRSNAQGEVIESLLPMVDNFERAKEQLKIETEKEKQIDASYQGIYKQFVEIMKSLSVAAVPTIGKPFDPSVHEAIAREESQEFNEGVVMQEFRRGFLLGERLLRPAMVKVSAGPGPTKVESTSQESYDSAPNSTEPSTFEFAEQPQMVE